MAGKDLYAVLGVERGASLDDIKKTYKKLARKYHPDVNPGDAQAEERFKEISAAYDALGDPEKRKLYDEFGGEGLKSGFDPEKARTYREWQERARATSSFRDRAGGFGDLSGGGAGFDLGDLFGDAAPFLRTRERPRTDVKTEMTVSFREAVLGTEGQRAPQRRARSALISRLLRRVPRYGYEIGPDL
jgi:DnaJ-class molecular chaperone